MRLMISLFCLGLFVLLAGCEINQFQFPAKADWARYLSRTDTLVFFARSNCGSAFFAPALTEDVFHQAVDISSISGKPWLRSILYIDEDNEPRRSLFNVAEILTIDGTRLAPSSTSNISNCVVLVEIPKSRGGQHPYYIASDHRMNEYTNNLNLVIFVLLVEIAVSLPAMPIITSDWTGGPTRTIALGCTTALLCFSCVVAFVYGVQPLLSFQKAGSYLAFFNELPRLKYDALQLTGRQLVWLVAGPPLPESYALDWQTWSLLVAIPWFVWLLSILPSLHRGTYWQCERLPLEALHLRCRSEGRSPTADEIKNAVVESMTNKKPWQLAMMRQKAANFEQHLKEIAEQL